MEAGEVRVGETQFSLVFHGKRGQMQRQMSDCRHCLKAGAIRAKSRSGDGQLVVSLRKASKTLQEKPIVSVPGDADSDQGRAFPGRGASRFTAEISRFASTTIISGREACGRVLRLRSNRLPPRPHPNGIPVPRPAKRPSGQILESAAAGCSGPLGDAFMMPSSPLALFRRGSAATAVGGAAEDGVDEE